MRGQRILIGFARCVMIARRLACRFSLKAWAQQTDQKPACDGREWNEIPEEGCFKRKTPHLLPDDSDPRVWAWARLEEKENNPFGRDAYWLDKDIRRVLEAFGDEISTLEAIVYELRAENERYKQALTKIVGTTKQGKYYYYDEGQAFCYCLDLAHKALEETDEKTS